MKIKITDSIMVGGEFVDKGKIIEVPEPLGNELIGMNRAINVAKPIEDKDDDDGKGKKGKEDK